MHSNICLRIWYCRVLFDHSICKYMKLVMICLLYKSYFVGTFSSLQKCDLVALSVTTDLSSFEMSWARIPLSAVHFHANVSSTWLHGVCCTGAPHVNYHISPRPIPLYHIYLVSPLNNTYTFIITIQILWKSIYRKMGTNTLRYVNFFNVRCWDLSKG